MTNAQIYTLVALAVYAIAMALIGCFSFGKSKTLDGFLIGGRKIGGWVSAFAYGTTYFSAVVFVGYAGQHGWNIGVGAIWIGIGNAVLGCLLSWLLFANRTRKMTKKLNARTMPGYFEKRYNSRGLKILAAVLNATMTGIGSEEVTSQLLERVMNSAGAAASLVPVIMEFTTETLNRQGSTNMAVAGQMRLLGQPEYRDVDKAQRVLTSLDEDALANLPAVMQGGNGTQVLVGPEQVSRELKDTSVVMTKFDIGDGMQGMIGVVGPTRMDYAKVTARLSYFAESLSKMFAKPEQPQLPAAPDKEE